MLTHTGPQNAIVILDKNASDPEDPIATHDQKHSSFDPNFVQASAQNVITAVLKLYFLKNWTSTLSMCFIPGAVVAVSSFYGTVIQQLSLFVVLAIAGNLQKQHADWPSNMMRLKSCLVHI